MSRIDLLLPGIGAVVYLVGYWHGKRRGFRLGYQLGRMAHVEDIAADRRARIDLFHDTLNADLSVLAGSDLKTESIAADWGKSI